MDVPDSQAGEAELCPNCGNISVVPQKKYSEQSSRQSTQNRNSGPLYLAILVIILLVMGIGVWLFFQTNSQGGFNTQVRHMSEANSTQNSTQNSQDMPIASKQHFSDKQIENWEKIVIQLDIMIDYYSIHKKEEHYVNIRALQREGCPTKPLEIWKKLKPLLRQKKPGAMEFREMIKLIIDLRTLAGLFASGDKKLWHDEFKKIAQDFNGLMKKVVKWGGESGHYFLARVPRVPGREFRGHNI